MIKSILKKVSTLILAAIFLANIFAPGIAAASNKIVIVGSSALLPLSLQGAKEYKQTHPSAQISASASSSIAGPQAVNKGAAQIGACDWDATKDVPGFKAFKGLVAHKVAVIPFATIVNSKNPVNNLTTAQLQGIFTGKITNWKEVGGKDSPIVVVNRAFGSGTRVNYQATALKGKNITKGNNQNYVEVGKSGDMVTKVGTLENAIGFCDLVYVKGDVKALQYNGVAATIDNVIKGKYPVYGTGYYLTKGQPTGEVASFIKYVQSAKFQNSTVKKMKFIPISAMKK